MLPIQRCPSTANVVEHNNFGIYIKDIEMVTWQQRHHRLLQIGRATLNHQSPTSPLRLLPIPPFPFLSPHVVHWFAHGRAFVLVTHTYIYIYSKNENHSH